MKAKTNEDEAKMKSYIYPLIFRLGTKYGPAAPHDSFANLIAYIKGLERRPDFAELLEKKISITEKPSLTNSDYIKQLVRSESCTEAGKIAWEKISKSLPPEVQLMVRAMPITDTPNTDRRNVRSHYS